MLQQIVDEYLKMFPEERAGLKLLLTQLADGDNMNNRKTLPGHVTGSAVVLSPDRTKILLIHHKLYDKWLQPGGHWDPDEASPWAAAEREAIEETSVKIAKQLPAASEDLRIPLRISAHPIKDRPEKNEQPHIHHDFYYVFLAADIALTHQAEEVHGAAWFAFDAPECENVEPVIVRMRELRII